MRVFLRGINIIAGISGWLNLLLLVGVNRNFSLAISVTIW